MNVNTRILICILLIAAFLFAAGCSKGTTDRSAHFTPSPVIPSPTSLSTSMVTATTREELVAFVRSAVAYAHTNTKEKALLEFSKKNGSFVKGELYIYAYDFNGTTIAHPVNPEKIGINRLNEKDAYNNLFIKDLRYAAYNGTGFSEYYYINPLHNNAVEKKLGYVEKIDDQWWLGSGIYEAQVNPVLPIDNGTPVTPEEVKAFVESAAAYARQNEKAVALAAFNDPKGPFVKGSVYVYALDYNGITLALPFQRDLVSQDFSLLSDATGQKFVKTEITLAKNGGGFLLFQYPNPSHGNAIEPKLSYVKPVDDTYWIGAGTYISGNTEKDARVKTFVEEAKAYAQKHGKEQALVAFNRKDGDFIKDDLYIFADDYNATVLAWPYRPDQIGVNRINATDLLGNEYMKEMVATAKRGNGTVLYFSENPLHNNATELKSSYIQDIDGTWFIGAGTYLAPGAVTRTPVIPSAPASIRTRDELVNYVQEAQAYALNKGREIALVDFNNQNGQFTKGESYIFAYTSNGTTLALPFQPELIGTNRWNITDPEGVRYIHDMARTAQGGSGFVQYRYPDPAENFSVKVKTSYVVDVDGSWFVGSGIYAKD